MEKDTSAFNILSGKPRRKKPLGRPRTILGWTLKKWVSIRGIGLNWLKIGIIGEPL